MRDFAKRILAHESRTNGSFAEETSAAFHAVDRLRPQLAILMGNGGVRALVLRSLALATAEVPRLRAARVNPDASLNGFEIPHAPLLASEFREGKVVLLAHLLGLMVVFIGENLTLSLVQQAWPTMPLSDLGLTNGVKNAKAKKWGPTRKAEEGHEQAR